MSYVDRKPKLSTVIRTQLAWRMVLLLDSGWTELVCGCDFYPPFFPATLYDYFSPDSEFVRALLCRTEGNSWYSSRLLYGNFKFSRKISIEGNQVKLEWLNCEPRSDSKNYFERTFSIITGCLRYPEFFFQEVRPNIDPCCELQLFGLLSSTFQPSFLTWHFLLDCKLKLSSN